MRVAAGCFVCAKVRSFALVPDKLKNFERVRVCAQLLPSHETLRLDMEASLASLASSSALAEQPCWLEN